MIPSDVDNVWWSTEAWCERLVSVHQQYGHVVVSVLEVRQRDPAGGRDGTERRLVEVYLFMTRPPGENGKLFENFLFLMRVINKGI